MGKNEKGKGVLKFGDRIKLLRAYFGMTQSVLAKYLDVSYQTIQNYEYGRAEPKNDNLIEISNIFNCSIDWLLTGKGKDPFQNQDAELIKSQSIVSTDEEQREINTKNISEECFSFCKSINNYPSLQRILHLLVDAMEMNMNEVDFLEYAGNLIKNQSHAARGARKKNTGNGV